MEQALQGFPGNINAMTLTLLDNVNSKNGKGLIKGLVLEALADGNSACPSWASPSTGSRPSRASCC